MSGWERGMRGGGERGRGMRGAGEGRGEDESRMRGGGERYEEGEWEI